MSRIILFDVDNTLLYSGGAGSLAMERAFQRLYGVEDGFRRIEFSGRTDWSIFRSAIEQQGVLKDHSEREFRQELMRFQEVYHAILPEALEEVEGGRLMPGVRELLVALEGRQEVRTGLATGNFRLAAFAKLRHFGLGTHFATGGFGDDAEDRGELVHMAIDRVSQGILVDPASVWIVGDTPLDIEAGHANGSRVLGVATGPLPVEGLRGAGADIVAEDLSDTHAVVSALLD